MGMTHGSKKTYARLGQLFGFCYPGEVGEVAEAIMLVQRDNGDRKNRKHARYVTGSEVNLANVQAKVYY
jgi:sulfite reductase (NADPH) hemoprotein beta-component